MWIRRAQEGFKIKFFDFLKNPKYYYGYFATNSMSDKILVLKLRVKMLLANQSAVFFKM